MEIQVKLGIFGNRQLLANFEIIWVKQGRSKRISHCKKYLDGWVGGWVGGWMSKLF